MFLGQFVYSLCITKTPGMWVTITGYGKVAGFGKL
jgi:hypothetical protein